MQQTNGVLEERVKKLGSNNEQLGEARLSFDSTNTNAIKIKGTGIVTATITSHFLSTNTEGTTR